MAQNNEQKIKGLFNTFVFIGNVVLPKDRTKFYSNGKSDGGYEYHKIQFGVKTNDSNVVYCEMQGGFSAVKENLIKTRDTNGNKIEVAWSDRNLESVINTVNDMDKFKVNFTSTDDKDTKMFLSEYDSVKYISENLEHEARVVVIGDVKVEKYINKKTQQEQTTIKYIPQKIRLAKDDEVNKAEITTSFVFDKDSWDDTRFKEEGKVDIRGYATTYDRTLTPPRNIFIPLEMVMDFKYIFENSMVTLTDEQKAMLLGMYKKYFTAKREQYFETQWKGEVFRGAVAQEITMEDLSPDEKLQIQLGVVDFETIAYAHKRNLAGAKVNEIRLMRPTNKFQNEKTGLKEVNKLTDYKEDDFVVLSPQLESLPMDDTPIQEDADMSLINSLFGAK